MKSVAFGKLLSFLNALERRHLHYTVGHYREEAIMVLIAVPGERWEVEFLDDGSVEVERFASSGEISGEEALAELFATYADPNTAGAASPEAGKLTTSGTRD